MGSGHVLQQYAKRNVPLGTHVSNSEYNLIFQLSFQLVTKGLFFSPIQTLGRNTQCVATKRYDSRKNIQRK